MNYAGKCVDLTASITSSYNQLRQESGHSYDYLLTGLATQSDFRERTRTLTAGGYVNLNYNINDRQQIGSPDQYRRNGLPPKLDILPAPMPESIVNINRFALYSRCNHEKSWCQSDMGVPI